MVSSPFLLFFQDHSSLHMSAWTRVSDIAMGEHITKLAVRVGRRSDPDEHRAISLFELPISNYLRLALVKAADGQVRLLNFLDSPEK